jgi:hypothetical protein
MQGKVVCEMAEIKKQMLVERIAVSNHQTYLYAVTNTNDIVVCDLKIMKVLTYSNISQSEVLGMLHNPIKNQLVVWNHKGQIKFIEATH